MKSYQIRLCNSCGLRYPIAAEHSFGARCPICMGDTRLVLTRGLIADPKSDRPESDLAPNPSTETRAELSVLLDNIRSAWNVGSILRSADGFGFTHTYLCGITPTPENDAVKKTSLGAEDMVTWSHHKDAVKLVTELKRDHWKIYTLEEDRRAKNIGTYQGHDAKSILILGNEITGVDPDLLDMSDNIFYIPMRGEKNSFNVAMAFSIAAYQLTRKF